MVIFMEGEKEIGLSPVPDFTFLRQVIWFMFSRERELGSYGIEVRDGLEGWLGGKGTHTSYEIGSCLRKEVQHVLMDSL